MYDKYYVRKKEIAENVLMIAICDVQRDGTSGLEDDEDPSQESTFNVGQVDILFQDYTENFGKIKDTIDDISK